MANAQGSPAVPRQEGLVTPPPVYNFSSPQPPQATPTGGPSGESVPASPLSQASQGSVGSPIKWRVLRLGVCAMDKKVQAPPMQNILQRLEATRDFEIVVFGNKVILENDVDIWPVVDCLIAFYSSGFPLEKAERYVELRRPFLVNSLREQRWLQDRRKMYAVLRRAGFDMPHHAVCSREPSDDPHFEWPVVSEGSFKESDDQISVDGVVVRKPFVEKPANADDHNVWIYFPSNAGGGGKKLFRKVKNKSAEFVPDLLEVRREGSYIYESFVKSGGTDIKVYTVGPDYAHAEARKSPVVDGKVMRDSDGKELRYPVLLNQQEKEICRAVVEAFNQNVCGLDILRTPHGKSYVIDVNGWAAVKKSTKYYDDCTQILHAICMAGCGMERHFLRHGCDHAGSLLSPNPSISDCRRLSDAEISRPMSTPPAQGSEELRCVLVVARHGDRTPKQKMKFKCSYPQLLEIHRKWASGSRVEAKLKSPSQLGAVLAAARELKDEALLAKRRRRSDASFMKTQEADEMLCHLILLQKVLKEGGHFSGINRKVQLKPTAWETREGEPERVTEIMVVLKYGGVLTPAGRVQAEILGREIREKLYPRSDGGGLLRLHSTYRHDLKIYCSDEGRVQISAAAFARGLLDLEGALTPILVSMVHKNTRMLDDIPPSTGDDIAQVRKLIHNHILKGDSIACGIKGEPVKGGIPEGMPSGPKELLDELLERIEALVEKLRERALSELQTLADAPPETGSQGWVNSERNSPVADIARELAVRPLSTPLVPTSPAEMPAAGYAQRSVASADVARLTEVMRGGATAEELAGELVGAGVPYNVNTAGKGTMWSDADTRAEGEEKKEKQMKEADKEPDTESAEGSCPYGGESQAMMHMRWDRLLRQLRNKEKDKWDLSKVPDVLDSVKYDTIHNSHLNLPELNDILSRSVRLGRGIIANEYGISSDTRMRIGATIMSPLLAKLLQDLNKACTPELPKYTKINLLPTPQSSAAYSGVGPAVGPVDNAVARALEARRGRGRDSATKETLGHTSSFRQMAKPSVTITSGPSTDELSPTARGSVTPLQSSPLSDGRESTQFKRFGGENNGDGEVTVRLDPSAAGASGVRSGTRNVVTRVYFTSESHIYGLMNVLRCANDLIPGAAVQQVVTEAAEKFLAQSALGYDYLSHLVIRVFEKPNAETAEDFRVEVDFSLGATDSKPAPDDKKPPPLARRVRLSSSRLHLARVKDLLDGCTKSPPVVTGAWEDKDASDGDNKEAFSVGVHGMKHHNQYRPLPKTAAWTP
eukprot:Hpha_TRINITY_DN13629_c0_g1::TRINITY_DN13629_c0_g1_i1::g.122727::m.122727/K13024/PPIP5K, VIP; inositol-hexakisphosphate/diphosphoinositol-pentakisphosphate 1-kinase